MQFTVEWFDHDIRKYGFAMDLESGQSFFLPATGFVNQKDVPVVQPGCRIEGDVRVSPRGSKIGNAVLICEAE